MGDSHVGLLARLMSQALRNLAGSIAKTNCVVIFINQLREKVGVMYGLSLIHISGKSSCYLVSPRNHSSFTSCVTCLSGALSRRISEATW